MTTKHSRVIFPYLPVIGVCLFVALYFIASLFYPGGSDVDESSKGFNWMHNYWCELMAARAYNGEANSARPIAIGGMFVLATSISICWYNATAFFENKTKANWLILYPGIFSMVSLILLFFQPHDLAINIAGVSGMVALIGVELGLYRNKLLFWFAIGIFCILLCLINNYIYYARKFVYYLPVIQKITFFFFLIWFSMVSINSGKSNVVRERGNPTKK